MESYHSRCLKILLNYPDIKVLTKIKTDALIREIIQKYQSVGINDIHYLWLYSDKIPMTQVRMTPDELLGFYKKNLLNLLEKLSSTSVLYLIIDCSDGRFIACSSTSKNYMDLLIDNYFDFDEIYFVGKIKELLLCVNHVFEVIPFN